MALANSRAFGPWSLAGTHETCWVERDLTVVIRPPFRSVATEGGRPQGAALQLDVSEPGSDGDNRGHHTYPAFQIGDSSGRPEGDRPVCLGGGARCWFDPHRSLGTVGNRTLSEVV
jgi:hypothetical protein